ncbi:MAG: DUF805 domain-containing protein [Chloroflexi bacterium]|nr:DUF805 domain-containing protein [Chloroflexota bacterium]
MSYLINPIVRLFDFRTRSSRREYWLYLLWMLPFYALVIGLTWYVSASAMSDPSGAADSTASTLAIVSGIVYLVLVLPLPALAVRRLQDTGSTGWLLFVPIYGVLRMAFFRGEAGANRFGNPPTR